ncbi:N-6 DNA methylase [Mucilaginibacter boryungensis]|uniref:SAM-dependent DNA methyltransferase n=1 Tax=Mucilaginibacter boryungensis TaxID=768480 RepID=A0ABR9XNS9_9SPHI|nr:N-6 DNA methylase [Mucilaginibacter boryungensis]MBE9668725.1 SAM-dependent DNA methyltransferase [Mucilaginibacter boryungensis]
MTQIKHLLTEFERFAYGQSLPTVFTEMLNWTLLLFKKCNNETEQQSVIEAYQTHPKVKQLTTLITMIGDLADGFTDPLGELYMHAISKGHMGQYFTPQHLCDMMAMMQIGTTSRVSQTVLDPACGSGRMLLATAKIDRSLQLYGADLDLTCCKMALINMLFNSLQGEIAHMNSLSNEFYTGYQICTTLVGTHYIPYYIEFTEPEKSRIWLRPLRGNNDKSKFSTPFNPVSAAHPINGRQGLLFDW